MNTISDQTVFLPEYVQFLTPPILRDVTFERCTIFGPAIIHLSSNVTIADSSFDGTLESSIIVLRRGQKADGVIALVNITFDTCRLSKIGIICTRRDARILRSGFNKNSYTDITTKGGVWLDSCK